MRKLILMAVATFVWNRVRSRIAPRPRPGLDDGGDRRGVSR